MDKTQMKLVMQTEKSGLDNTFSFLLIRAAENGFTTDAEDLIKKGADVNAINKVTKTRALDLASANGNTEIVHLLIKNGANIEDEQFHFLPLESAARNGHTETAALLIEHGAKINKTRHFHMTALHLASQNGHNNTVKMLIQKGANVNGFEPALMMAATMGHTDVAETLIEEGANIDYQDNQDFSVLETALMCGKTSVSKLLIEKGANIDGALMQAFKMNNTEVVDILLNKETDVKHKDKYGKTLLMMAATYGRTELISNLIDKGSDIEEKDNEGMTAIMYAANNGCLKVVEMLIEKKSHVNEKSNDGRSPLMFACASNLRCKDAVEKLIEHGAYVNEGSKDGKTALMYASNCGCRGNVEKLIEHGADINERCKEGWTALIYASHQGFTDIVKILIDKGADLNIKAINGDTALILATRYENAEIVKVLLDKGADVHIQGKDGFSARQIAMISFSGQNMLKMFVEQKCVTSTKTVQDCEALNKPLRTETMPTGHNKKISNDTNSTKQSGHSDEVLNGLSHDIRPHTNLEGSEMDDMNGRTGDYLETTGQVTQEKDETLEKTWPVTQDKEENLLRETHHKSFTQFKKRKRTKRKRSQSVHKEVPYPKGASSSGSKVKSSKDFSSHGMNVIFNISKEHEELQTPTLQTQKLQHFCPSKDSDDTLSSDNTDKSDLTYSDIAEEKSPDRPTINNSFTDNVEIQPNIAAMGSEGSITKGNSKRSKYFTSDDTHTSVQNDDELPECSLRYKDKFLKQLADFFSDHKQDTDNNGPLQDAKDKYLSKKNHIVFKWYHIDHVDHAHLQNPMYVNITDTTYCVIDKKT